jgi:hypothetical protein
MSSFYMYSYNALPTTPPTGLWYASWSADDQCVHWSQTKPTIVPDGESSWVVGVVDQESCPLGATTLSTGGGKSLPPRPNLRADSIPSFQTQFGQWVVSLKGGADLTE